MQAQTSIEITIERILPGGVGLAHAEGRTLFVALAAPGDVARVRIDQIRGQLAFASIEEIVTPSPVRVEPPCPYFGECGGCQYQHIDYAAQLEIKHRQIAALFERVGGFSQAVIAPVIPPTSVCEHGALRFSAFTAAA